MSHRSRSHTVTRVVSLYKGPTSRHAGGPAGEWSPDDARLAQAKLLLRGVRLLERFLDRTRPSSFGDGPTRSMSIDHVEFELLEPEAALFNYLSFVVHIEVRCFGPVFFLFFFWQLTPAPSYREIQL